MTCEELNALLAEGAELPEEGETHLAACANCRAAAQRWAAVRQGLAALRAERQPPFLHARIMAAVRQAAAPPLPWWRRVPRAAWASAGVAAVLVVGVLAIQGVVSVGRVERAVMDDAARQAALPAATAVEADRRPRPGAEAMAKPSESVAQEDGDRGSAAPPQKAQLREGRPPTRRAMAQEQGKPLQPRRDLLAQPAPAPFAAVPSRAAPGNHDKGEPPDAVAGRAVTSAGREQVRPAAEPAAAAAAPRWRRETAVGASPPAKVAVALLAASGEEVATLLLDEAAAPAPAAAWVVVIGQDKRAVLEGPGALDEVLPAWQRVLAGAELPAGRYRAVRLPR